MLLAAAPRDGGGCSSVEYNPTICFWVFAFVCVYVLCSNRFWSMREGI